jgi:hypothetical protein
MRDVSLPMSHFVKRYRLAAMYRPSNKNSLRVAIVCCLESFRTALPVPNTRAANR